MKKMLFYVSNSIICSIFLTIRWLFDLIVIDKDYILDSDLNKINIITFILITALLLNIILGYFESKKL